MTETAAHLVDEVLPIKPLRQWVLSFPFQLRYLMAAHPNAMSGVLQIFHRSLNTFLAKKAGLKAQAKTGAITFIQRFGGSLNLNIHFHTLCLDGTYSFSNNSSQFHLTGAPKQEELDKLLKQVVKRIVKYLEKKELILKDEEDQSYLPAPKSALEHIQGSSITYRIALGKNKGQKALTLQALPNQEQNKLKPFLAKYSGFSLHAGVSCQAHERKKLEHICRYIARPSLSEERLSLNPNGQIVYKLKTPYDNGTTHIVLEPLDLMSRLASLVPKPRVNLTRYFGVFAPHFKHRKLVVLRGKKEKTETDDKQTSPTCETQKGEKENNPTPLQKALRLTWAQRLKRVFNIDIETCPKCSGKVKIISSIEDPKVIKKILDHLKLPSQAPTPWPAKSSRGPPEPHTEADPMDTLTISSDDFNQNFPVLEFS